MDLNLIVKMKFGAHMYGTATSKSDIDYRGVFLPSKAEVLLGRIPKRLTFSSGDNVSKNTPQDIDVEIYSLHYFISLACEGQIVAMDMLHAPDSCIEVRSAIWEAIVRERQRFYTVNLTSFVNYARRQTAKYGIKGSRLDAVAKVLSVLKSEDPTKKLRSVWDKLPRVDYCNETGAGSDGLRRYEVCGKTFQESAQIRHIVPVLEKFLKEYGARAKEAAKNRNIDWKAVSHALRAAFQIKELFTRRTITFPFKEADLLIRVKEGKLDYLTEAAPLLEALIAEVEELASASDLPETVDTSYWDSFICNTVERELFGKKCSKAS
jgi:predicted nucleotidyltransferase